MRITAMPTKRRQPAGPVSAYKTYSLSAPRDTLVRAACELVDCAAWRGGWRCLFDERIWCGGEGALYQCQIMPPCGRHAAAYVRHGARRTYTERPGPGGLTEFLFEPGQRCFAEHRTRPTTFGVRGGDWRQNLGPIRQHTRPGDWVEDFGENQQTIVDRIERG